MKKVTKKQLGSTTKKYQTGGPAALKKAIADSATPIYLLELFRWLFFFCHSHLPYNFSLFPFF